MKRTTWLITGLLSVVLILFLAREPILQTIGSFLVVQDELKKMDVIIVLGGSGERVKEAARLYHQDFSDNMIMTGAAKKSTKSEAAKMKHHAGHLDIPSDKIILEPKAGHTFEHPIFVKPIMEAHGFKSAIVVSSPYHMRRTAMLFDRAFKKSGIELIYYPVQDGWFEMDQWWKNDIYRGTVRQEYTKMAVNFFGTRVSKFVINIVRR